MRVLLCSAHRARYRSKFQLYQLFKIPEPLLYRPRWLGEILDEFHRFFVRMYDDEETADRQRSNLETAFPEALVEAYKTMIEALELPDKDDRHVLACAIKTKAAVIVTENLTDFPEDVLSSHDITAIGLDDFIADILDMAGVEAIAALRQMRERFQNPEIDAEELILPIEKLGLNQTENILSEYQDLL